MKLVQSNTEMSGKKYYQTKIKDEINEFLYNNIELIEKFDSFSYPEVAKDEYFSKINMCDIYDVAFSIDTIDVIGKTLISIIPTTGNRQLLQVASYKAGLSILGSNVDAFESRLTPPIISMVGGEVLRRLSLLGIVEIATVSGRTNSKFKEYIVTPYWDKRVLYFIECMHSARRLPAMLVEPIRHTHNKLGGYLTESVREPIRNDRRGMFVSREDRECINYLDSMPVRLNLPTNEILQEYVNLKSQQVHEARIRLLNEDNDDIARVADFDVDNFIKELNYFTEEDGEIMLSKTMYVLHGMDNAGRKYERNTLGGIQQDKFLASLVCYRDTQHLDERGRYWLERYADVLRHEIMKCGDSVKDRIDKLGHTHRLNQCMTSLAIGLSSIPIELDFQNNGVQIYSCFLRGGDARNTCGMTDSGMDIYIQMLKELSDKLGLPDGLLVRSHGKKPVMVSIYGAGKKTIMQTGGDGWTGIYTLLQQLSLSNNIDYLQGKSVDDVWMIFLEVMHRLLPGVYRLMKYINSYHGRRYLGTDMKMHDRARYTWITPCGSKAVLYPESSQEFKAFVPSRDGTKKHELKMKTFVFDSDAKRSALAPVIVQSCDSSLVTWITLDCKQAGIPIMCKHDAYFPRPNDCDTVVGFAKDALWKLASGNYIDKIINDLAGRDVDISSLKFNDMTRESLDNANPLDV